MAPLLGFLTHPDQWARGVRIAGDGGAFQDGGNGAVGAPFQNHVAGRAPTVSFVMVESSNGKPRLRSKEVVEYFDKRGKVNLSFGAADEDEELTRCPLCRSASGTAISMRTLL